MIWTSAPSEKVFCSVSEKIAPKRLIDQGSPVPRRTAPEWVPGYRDDRDDGPKPYEPTSPSYNRGILYADVRATMKEKKEATFMDIMKNMFADVVDATKRDMGVELGMLANKKATELVLGAVKVPAIFRAGLSDNPLVESIIGMVVATVLKNVFNDNEKAMKAADVMVQASVATLVRSADLGNVMDRLLGGITLKDLRFATGTEEKEKVIVAGE